MFDKYLIVCTFRSGSTILATLLQEATGLEDLGEYVFNGKDKVTSLMKYTMTPFSKDLLEFEKVRKERIEYLKSTNGWIVRNPVVAGSTNKELIDFCADREDTKLIFLYRRNMIDQYLSDVNTAYRSMINRGRPKNKFYNNEEFEKFESIDLPAAKLKEWAIGTLTKVEAWRALYEQYKAKCQLVCYEDHIEPLELRHIGITESVVNRYYSKQQHLVKTPYNCTNFKHDSFQNYVDFFDSYKYITDITPG